ncbi:helix-turn-helix transcriptional regulator [Streptomyces sp. P9(2023)]|uniref:helix-turn-helix domain-containing protein n=1 Tax=Streptomyces sp. P9(2023) TaxID=3064394 RepID=UPI0028F3E58B|nr:helix-turn-helix transcriptional regulator [Streptomyces sp. P9(2023)]MDT9693400.1 helix-turn-helix transcriptional regulator [Streptomyces sp. P9(2023)]
MVGDEFAALLGRLKERSGLSYGTLGKRLHMSGSTLHRYVTGDAVPTDYAPLERFARLCKATPDELVELHRLWVHADVTRQRKGSAATEPAPAPVPPPAPAPEPESVPEPAREQAAAEAAGSDADAGRDADVDADPQLVVSGPGPGPAAAPRPRRGWRRRTVAIAGAAVVAAVVTVALVLNLPVTGEGDDKRQSAGSSSVSERPETAPATKAPSASPSNEGSTGPTPSGSASASASRTGAPAGEGKATAPSVATNAYKWDSPCSQHYLMNREPEQVPPPPVEPDAPGWVSALGGVASGEHMLALTVQGTGKQTVVVEALYVRVVKKGAPLAWNDYSMGVGCGGNVFTKSFAVDLDSPRPDATPASGQRDFPYKVSESDPEVFYVTARVQAHDVSWYLEMDWSSGDQHGTVRIDDNGKPFRTSGNLGRPGYDRPLGGNEWTDRPTEDNSTQVP